MTRILLVIVGSLLISINCIAQNTESDAYNKTIEFMNKIDPAYPLENIEKTTTRLMGGNWSISINRDKHFTLEKETLTLKTYENISEAKKNRSREWNEDNLMHESEVNFIADNMKSKFVDESFYLEYKTRPSQESNNQTWAYSYSPRPHDYTAHDGNRIHIAIDGVTGSVLSITHESGWQYVEPNILITEQEATRIVAQHEEVSESECYVVKKAYSRGQYGTPSQYLMDSKTCRLGYLVNIPNGTLIVDCETGDILFVGHIQSVPHKKSDSIPSPAEQQKPDGTASFSESNSPANNTKNDLVEMKNSFILGAALSLLCTVIITIFILKKKIFS